MQRGFAPILIVLGIGILVAAIGGAYYFGKISQIRQPTDQIQPQNQANSQTPVVSNAESPTPSLPPKYSTRLFDINQKFIGEINFPKELLNIKDSDLIEISCSQIYNQQIDGQYSYYINNQAENPTVNADNKILSYINQVKTITNKNISGVQICQTKSGKLIGIFSEQLNGGGAGQDTYIGLINADSINKLEYIAHQPYAYFGCNEPLQLLADNIFYIRCNAGDGLGGYSQINKVNLVDNTVTSMISCISQGDPETHEIKITCN